MASPAGGRRPLIAIPARFSRRASALRYEAEVNARALVAAVFAAGGEPVTVHPYAPGGWADAESVARRLHFADGVLLPGGGDLAGHWSGRPDHPGLYDVDVEQDAFDLAVARFALAGGLPLLAVCRGLQVVNVARGGTLHAEMSELEGSAGDHRNRVHRIAAEPGSLLAETAGLELDISCYHHQCLDGLGAGLRPVAWSEDGVVEAVEWDGPSWFLGVQWHPEDTAARVLAQQAVFAALVAAAGRHAAARAVPVPDGWPAARPEAGPNGPRPSARSAAGPGSSP
jgi:putative glutamine amidotransferase